MREMSISHKLHPARQQGKSLSLEHTVKFCLATNKKLAIGTSNVDATYARLKLEFADAKISKFKNYVLVEVK